MLRLIRDCRASTAVEFGLTAPVFFMALMAAIEFGLMMWTQLGLQHASEMAARCASVNTAICGSASTTQSYAVTQAFGLSLPASTFTVATAACGSQVTANHNFAFITSYFGAPTMALAARACFPK